MLYVDVFAKKKLGDRSSTLYYDDLESQSVYTHLLSTDQVFSSKKKKGFNL